MKIFVFSALPFIVFIAGCANPYSKFYNDRTGGINIAESSDLIMPIGKPKLIQGSNVEVDGLQMLENGYWLLGESSFNAGPINQNSAIAHAKKVHADTVIVYSRYTNTVSGSMPLTLPNSQTSYHSGSIYGSGGGYANYSGSSTTYGTSTTYMPYHVNRSDYYATFWIETKPMSLGIHLNNLTDELRRKVESNKGVYIVAVVKNSPAFNADLLNGDIIRKFNNIEVANASHFTNLMADNKKQQIELKIFRNGKTIVKQIQLK